MRVWEAGDGNGPRLVERPTPEVGARELLVRVRAVGLNYRDRLVVEGGPVWPRPAQRVPACDAAGEIVAVGASTSGVRVGDRVVTFMLPNWDSGPIAPPALQGSLGGRLADGVMADLVALPLGAVAPLPAGLSFVEGAALPCAGVTAWNALTQAPTKPGDHVLVQGTGGVAMLALQFASSFGARVTVVSRSARKLEQARALGAVATVDTTAYPAWDEEVLRQTDGRGVDHVIDVGGASTIGRSVRAVRMGGTVSLIGHLDDQMTAEIDLRAVIWRAIRLQGVEVGSRAMLLEMLAHIQSQQLRPPVAAVFPFEAFARALDALSAGAHLGKIVISDLPHPVSSSSAFRTE
jgi:NADPH:quinone reductase-like Zn-dependent oxidoreductase